MKILNIPLTLQVDSYETEEHLINALNVAIQKLEGNPQVYPYTDTDIAQLPSRSAILNEGQNVDLNVPFTYEIGEEGRFTNKTLETIEDCIEEAMQELSEGLMNPTIEIVSVD